AYNYCNRGAVHVRCVTERQTGRCGDLRAVQCCAVQCQTRMICGVMENELEQLGEQIAEQAAHLDAAMHRLLADLRAFDTRGGWHIQGAASCAHWLAWRVGWDLVTA